MKKRLLALVAVIGFCVTIGVLIWRPDSRNVVYQGKTLTSWLFQLSSSDPKARAQAEAAFDTLGTNALPELTRLAQTKDAEWRTLIWVHADRLPRRVRRRILGWAGSTNACVIRPMAARALGRLGPAAVPAMPALIQMLRQGSSPYEQQTAAQALTQIGPQAVPPLIDMVARGDRAAGGAAAIALLWHYRWPRRDQSSDGRLAADQTAQARQQAIETLGASGRDDELVVKVLARATGDPDPGVRLAALKGLARANRNLEAALPQLLGCANDKSPGIRELSARILGRIRPPAGPAITALTDLAQDNEAPVRLAAQQGLQTIDAGRFTNSTPPSR